MYKSIGAMVCGGLLLASAVAWGEPFCGAMTREKAAVILGCTPDQIQHRSSAELQTCSFSKDLLHSITYALYQEENAPSAQRLMEKIVDGLKMLVDCTAVAGIGDAAISCAGDRAKRLLVRQGALVVDILSPADLVQKQQVAKGVLP